MKFEVVEDGADWIVRRDGVELARYGDQDQALADIAERLRNARGDLQAETDGGELSYSLAVRYGARA